MAAERPSVVVVAGPNGAGKSTVAPRLVADLLGVSEFVDADVLARALPPSRAGAVAAGCAMLRATRCAGRGATELWVRDDARESTEDTVRRRFGRWNRDADAQ
jgi:predicted ABC-type ATPase